MTLPSLEFIINKVKQATQNGFEPCWSGFRSQNYIDSKCKIRAINPIAMLVFNEQGKVNGYEEQHFKFLYFKNGFLVSEIRKLGITDSERNEFINGTRRAYFDIENFIRLTFDNKEAIQSPYRKSDKLLSAFDLGIAVYHKCKELNIVE